MTVVGEAFVAISPEGAGFAKKLEAQLHAAGIERVGVVAGAAVTAAIGAAFLFVGEKFAHVSHQIQQETGATGETLAKLFDTVKTELNTVPASFHDATAAVDELFRRGVPVGTMLTHLAEQELFLAKITKTDLTAAVESTTGLFKKFNVPLADQSRELDVLFKATQASGKSLDDIVTPLRTGAAALQQFGFSLDKSIALVASLQRSGVNVQPALAALRLAFGKIAKEGKDPQTVLARLVKELRDGKDPAKGMADAIKLFGTRSGVELATAIKAGRFDVDKLLKSITDGKGGIIETGLATLSLGDQFLLLKNKVLTTLEPIGTEVLHAFDAFVVGSRQRLGDLLGAVTRFGEVALPALAPLGVLLVGLGRAAGPVLTAFGSGLDAITKGLQALGSPLTTVIVLVGLGAVAFHAYTTASLLAVQASVAFDAAVAFATGPIGFAIIAITALGVAYNQLASLDQGKKQRQAVKDLTDSFSQANGQLKPQIAGLAAGFEELFKKSNKAISPNLPGVLGASGSNITQLSKAVSGGATEWGVYYGKVIRALAAAGNSPKALDAAATALDRTRAAVINSVRADVARFKAAGLITSAQVAQIQTQATLADGSIDYARAVDLLNKAVTIQVAKIAAVKAQTEAQKLATFQATGVYRGLVDQLSRGGITTDEFKSQLASLGDISSKTAGAIGDELVKAIDTFVSGAVGALPQVGGAIDQFTSDIASAQQQLASDRDEQARLQAQLTDSLATKSSGTANGLAKIADKIALDQLNIRNGVVLTTKTLQHDLDRQSLAQEDAARRGGSASASLSRAIADNNQKIREDYAKLIAANSPLKFVKQLETAAVSVLIFQSNLQKLIDLGFGTLAGELAKKGPEAAGALAGGLASDPAKAKLAEKALEASNTVTAKYTEFLRKNFPELTKSGSDAGAAIAKGIEKGITDGTPLVVVATNKLGNAVVNAINRQFIVKSPSRVMRDLGVQLSTGFALGIEDGATRVASSARKVGLSALQEFRALRSQVQAPPEAIRPPTTTATIIASGLSISGQSGAFRADARQQQAEANSRFDRGPLFRDIVMNEKVDPLHLAAQIAFQFRDTF